ncbi:MAG: response regulator [Candidatus Odinarchaeota archaeon]
MLTHFIIKFVRNVLVNASSSPEVAIKCIEEKNYDIIITDYQMPRMNGVELIKRARNKGIKTW